MFAICIESSHKKGMGHLFRMINFVKVLEEKGEHFIFIINDNEKSKQVLKKNNILYITVDLNDFSSNWEKKLIREYNITYWINDRLATNYHHTKNILETEVKIITFDDLGEGAKNSHLNICALFNKNNLEGQKILKGIDYLILNPEIIKYRRKRVKINNILVTLGGSDTYGVTIKVLRLLKKYKLKATIHIGPSFEHIKELNEEVNSNFKIISYVPSLIEEFSKYDLSITGGGITPCEANASGLPCLIVANEVFEIPNAKYLESIGSSLFLGFHESIDDDFLKNLEKIDLNKMSQKGLSIISLDAIEKIYKEIIQI